MYTRNIQPHLEQLLRQFPAVALLGPRQAGKTTLARSLPSQSGADGAPLYLDLELPSVQARLEDAESFLRGQGQRLVILDEVQRMPEVFPILRGLIDETRTSVKPNGRFLLLGSASGALLRQSGESLAGRMAVLELQPFTLAEVATGLHPLDAAAERLWVRGGFPLSWLAASDDESFVWRQQFVRSYLEREIPALAPRLPVTTLQRLWTMLAHAQGSLLDQSRLAGSIGMSGQSVGRYIDVLCDLMVVRRLPPWHGNPGKRLVRSPKVYVRDPGIVHALLGLRDLEAVLSHPVAGGSWEGMVIEQLTAAAPQATANFYRTAQGAEADLVLEWPNGRRCAIEVKRSAAARPARGFHIAAQDIGATEKWLVAPVRESYAGSGETQVMDVLEAVRRLKET